MADEGDSRGDPRVAPGAISRLLEDLVGAGTPPELPTLEAGMVFGRFRLLREIGRGGFGVVWEARDEELGRKVAFKLVRAGSGSGEDHARAEAEAVAQLQHPNLVTLHDVGRCDHGPYLILELLRGETLTTRLARGPLPAPEAIGIAVQMARGLAHAHGEGVVHRDLKPSNVFLCERGPVKLLDFGLAHAFGRSWSSGGTSAYMSPERWREAPEDERSDVFTLGVVLHQMLTGTLPFPDDGGRSVCGPDPAPALVVPGFPELGPTVARMLAQDPAARLRDGSEALAELRRAALTTPGDGPTAPVTVRRRWTGAQRTAAAITAVVLLVGATATALLLRAQALPSGPPSVAVLPFTDLSAGKDQEYFSEGLAEEILNELAHVDGLRVPGRMSSFSFKGTGEDVPTIARKLRVATLLQGTVRREGDQVRVTAKLVDAASGREVWSERYERKLTSVFAVQDDIARAVVNALKVRILSGPLPAATARRDLDPEAYRQFLLGRDFARRGIGERDLRMAAEAFEKATVLDPGYAPAWAGLSGALLNASDYATPGAAVTEARQRSYAAAEQAIAVDPGAPDGYLARALARQVMSSDFPGAQADIEKAYALAPGDVRANRDRGQILTVMGRPGEALESIRKAVDLDPLDGVAWTMLGVALSTQGDAKGARVAFERAREIIPDGLWIYLGELSLQEGQPAAALAEFERAPDEVWRTMGVAAAQHSLGQPEASQAALDRLTVRFADNWAYQIAGVHAWRGERDAAFRWLEKAYRQHDAGLLAVKFDPLMQALRGDPRYADLLRRMNLPAD